jgi:hypothetical protein
MARTKKNTKPPICNLNDCKLSPPVKNSTRDQTSEHGTLSEKDRTEGVGALAHEGETSTAIRVSRNEIKVDSGDLPEKTKPDEEPQIPAQKDELQNGDADEHIPETSRGKVPASTGIGIPSRGLHSDPNLPEPEAESVDNKQEPDLGGHGIAQPHG